MTRPSAIPPPLFRFGAATFALWIAAWAPAAADPIQIFFSAVPLQQEAPDQDRVGGLVFRGGLTLSSSDRRFGGWSDLRVDADGKSVLMLSDIGRWLRLGLGYDGQGRLSSIESAETGPLIGKDRQPLATFSNDSEGLARAEDGGWIVSFENGHRLWRYPLASPPFSLPPVDMPTPPGLGDASFNDGIEALTALGDGRFLALTEGLYDATGANVGWVGGAGGFAPLAYVAAPGFKPTAAALLPDGDVVVLERRFSLFGGFAARLARVQGGAPVAGARLTGAEIARLQQPFIIDNFEGIDARTGPLGETLLYVVSDDNFSVFQRTLLLMFALAAPDR